MQLTNKEIERNMGNFIGKEVILLSPHPYAGKIGVTVRVEKVKGKSKPAMVVKLDSGIETFVLKASQLFFIIN